MQRKSHFLVYGIEYSKRCHALVQSENTVAYGCSGGLSPGCGAPSGRLLEKVVCFEP